MHYIGITGGVGSGKSEILNYIRKHYRCEIYLADEVAHLVKEPGQECYFKLVELLGQQVLQPDGTIHKERMAQMIFSDEALLKQVNGLIHPAVKKYLRTKMEEALKKPELELFFVEAALLLEDGYKELLDELWYVYTKKTVRIERLKKQRGYSEEKILAIMERQLPDEVFLKQCDFVIDNSNTLSEAYEQIDKRLEAYTWLREKR